MNAAYCVFVHAVVKRLHGLEKLMPVSQDQPAPYAPTSAIMEMVTRHRNKGLQAPVDADVLARSGISDSLIPRTLQAMKVLDLIDDEGQPTEVFEGMRLAPEGEYQQRMAEWLNAAYADALLYVDPKTDDETAIRDAFRKYTPTGQQGRMVTLFIGLFTAAGVMPAKEKSAPKRSVPRPRKLQQQTASPSPSPRVAPTPTPTPAPAATVTHNGLPPAVAGLLSSLPAVDGKWTKSKRDSFMTAFEAVIDLSFEIEPVTNTATDH